MISLERTSIIGRWAILLALSIVSSVAFLWARLPAALLLGPMLSAIIVATAGGAVRIPTIPHLFAQAVIGCMVARAITPEIVATFSSHWLVFFITIASVVLVSCGLGGIFSRLNILPGTTAIWGLLPGAASVMMLMSKEFGADSRLVAFMQYLRVVVVASSVSTIARFWPHSSQTVVPAINWFPSLHPLPFGVTLILVLVGMIAGAKTKIPAAVLLFPMTIGGILHVMGLITVELPQWLLSFAYAFLGWSVGIKFTADVVKHAARAFPQTILSIVLMVLFCFGLAFLLVATMHVDLLTAYLATSPGGMDSIAIIAANSPVNLSFVMALQTVRFLFVLALGPAASKFVASKIQKFAPASDQQLSLSERVADNELIEQMNEDDAELD